jgi:tetratricopeptide (TPR) repeat protein
MTKRTLLFLIGFFTIIIAVAQPKKQAAVAALKAGMDFKAQGVFDQAIISFKKAIALDKKYDSAYFQLGMLYTQISMADSAILLYKKAVKTNPGYVNGYIALGNIYRDYKSNPEDAITNYLQALKIDSTNKVTLYNMAWCYNAKADHREAIKYAVRSLQIDNNYIPAYNELGHAYNTLKAYEEGAEQFKKHLAISVNEIPLLYCGYCYIELKQKDNALRIYEELNKLNPKRAEFLKKKIDAM